VTCYFTTYRSPGKTCKNNSMKKYKLKNLDCASCAAKVEEGVGKLEEVKFVSVNFATTSMTIDTDDLEKVKSK